LIRGFGENGCRPKSRWEKGRLLKKITRGGGVRNLRKKYDRLEGVRRNSEVEMGDGANCHDLRGVKFRTKDVKPETKRFTAWGGRALQNRGWDLRS